MFNNYLLFLIAALQDFKTTGDLLPSSKFLARKMVAEAHIASLPVVVELGAGTGAITKYILAELPAEGRLIAVESNSRFSKLLRERFFNDHRLTIITDNALNLPMILNHLALGKVFCIISGIPFANILNHRERENLLKSIYDSLATEGRFIQFQHSLLTLKELKPLFKKVEVSFEWRNLPPAFIYTCQKWEKNREGQTLSLGSV